MKNDHVDMALAEFINNYPERNKLKVLFMRDQEGVYQFGSKRVAIKVDMDKINVRVGGGYLSIDEFLDQYTNIELQKRLERKEAATGRPKSSTEKSNGKKNVMKKMQKENLALSEDEMSPDRSYFSQTIGGPMTSLKSLLNMSHQRIEDHHY